MSLKILYPIDSPEIQALRSSEREARLEVMVSHWSSGVLVKRGRGPGSTTTMSFVTALGMLEDAIQRGATVTYSAKHISKPRR